MVVFELAVQLLVLTFVITKRSVFKKINLPFLFALTMIGLLSIFHLIFSQSPLTLFGNPIRLQGTFLLWHLMAFAAISSQATVRKIPALVPIASALLLLAGALFLNPNITGRAVGTLGEPNALAATAIFIWPFINGRFYLRSFALIFAIVIVSLTRSQSAIIAIFLQILTLASIYLFGFTKKVLVFALILLVLSLSLPFFQQNLYESREKIWKVSIFAGFFILILGAGFGNAETQIEKAAYYLNSPIKLNYVDSAHNFLLDWWIQGGILGLLSITFLSIRTLYLLTKKKMAVELVALLGIIAIMSFNPASVVTLAAFWWLIGRGFSHKT